jgi:AcrR family transcriptional regulator
MFYVRTAFVSSTVFVEVPMTRPHDDNPPDRGLEGPAGEHPAPPPPPPWLPRRPERVSRRQGRAPLSRELIVETALGLLDREGLDSMTMRRVAQDLGTGPASLYAHVANLRELEDLVFDRAAAEITPRTPDPERWQEQLADLMFEMVTVMRRHPGVARFALGRVPMGENALAVTDTVLGMLKAGGVPDRDAAWAVDMLGLFVSAAGYEEAVRQQQEQGEDSMREWYDQFTDYLANLPSQRYPNVVRMAPFLAVGSGDERLRFGINLLVAGLAATVPQAGRS